MKRRKRKHKKNPAPEAAQPVGDAIVAVLPSAPSRSWRVLMVFLGALVIIGAAALTIPHLFSSRTNAPPTIIEGDGVKGPRGMLWIPGGEFLMGSDHKLAQRNERPAHKVRVHGFWM